MRRARTTIVALFAVGLAGPAAPAPAPGGGAPLPPFLGVAVSTTPSPERLALEKLMTENAIEREKAAQKLLKLTGEHDELQLRSGVLAEKQKIETADLDGGLKKLSLEGGIAEEKQKQSFRAAEAELKKLKLENDAAAERDRRASMAAEAELKKLKLENDAAAENQRKALAEQRQEVERLKAENDLKREKVQALALAYEQEKNELDIEMKRLEAKSRKLRVESEDKTVSLTSDLDLREKKDKWKAEANREPDFLKEPFKDGRLTISDRRIPLNGPIMRGTADFVTERIEYFNNKSEALPIFVVIDNSPGGSVMEGYRIVKAIRASKAPVYVVVKSFAASMAAVITTLAPHSYAYPNAIILHHQMSYVGFGNMTMQKEQLEIAKEWYRRLAAPVAEKMGTTVDAMVKKMYEHNSEGDWQEFADKAEKLKWVDGIVHEIRETGVLKKPSEEIPKPPPWFLGLKEETDAKGQRFVTLPRLDPFDFYYLYNPDQYYR